MNKHDLLGVNKIHIFGEVVISINCRHYVTFAYRACSSAKKQQWNLQTNGAYVGDLECFYLFLVAHSVKVENT